MIAKSCNQIILVVKIAEACVKFPCVGQSVLKVYLDNILLNIIIAVYFRWEHFVC